MSQSPIVCKLTSPELQERRSTVIAALQKQVIEKKEIAGGYSFKFGGEDLILDQLNDFIKTERQCCEFFTFTVKVSGEKSSISLDITGPTGTKGFIEDELRL